jgi:APA family basic amino acid/polyamine antiporter
VPGPGLTSTAESISTRTGTARAVGLTSATALVIAHTIAVGIFLTPAELIGALAAPVLTLALWAGCGLCVIAGALTFGELAARFPVGGGPYVYLREAWGERVAFLYGWQSMMVMDPGVTAALATGLAEYTVLLWPAAAGLQRWIAVAAIWTLAGVSIAGLTLSARVLNVMTAFKLAAFAAVVALAFASDAGSWAHFTPPKPPAAAGPPVEALAIGLVSVFFSFGGFWEASRIAGEVKHATRTMPLALALGVGTVTIVYVATTAAFIYLVPVQQTTGAAEFARLAGENMLGANGPAVLAWIVVLSVIASALALLIMAPRLYVAMGADHLFPHALAAVHQTTGTPVRATLLLATLASMFVAVGTFQQIVAFFMCTTLGFVALAAGGLFVVRRRDDAQTFATPGYPVTPAIFVLLVVAVVVLVAANRPWQAAAGLGVILMGLLAYRVFAGNAHAGQRRR